MVSKPEGLETKELKLHFSEVTTKIIYRGTDNTIQRIFVKAHSTGASLHYLSVDISKPLLLVSKEEVQTDFI